MLNALFQPFTLRTLTLKNRFVMAPMTRSFSPGGIPGPDVAAYYRRRAEGDVGLILSEGTVIERASSSNDPDVPHFHGEAALHGWKHVIDEVHAAGGRMGPQLWHMGVMPLHKSGWSPPVPFEGPSDRINSEKRNGRAMSDADIADTIAAFGRAAHHAQALGFDLVELHGAHRYLIDQFFWNATNTRTDRYGGTTLAERTRFACEVIREVRRQVGQRMVVQIRISQWKPGAYDNKLATTPREMEAWLTPLIEAGADLLHCSQRRFWEPEFDGSDLNFAGWAKKLTGIPVITVGSVGLSGEFTAAFRGDSSTATPLDELVRRFDRGDFDLVAVGRALLMDPHWTRKIRDGRTNELLGFSKEALQNLR
ncbi:MAG TPA: NADH:flavin oxidoreductase [Flavobacteriales bacterium]|jgi:2,4-dienoyl-CoA reductase-like NADH-dependent reductase (Old Yellow Enzyme family)|nr:NADH:flavin oxidoreductase [Flavobacteriales bacterium]HMU13780.1 NADH:flavin oxidoreductase [Flavobacteriales bacterium]